MSHADETDFLADFHFAFHGFSIGAHVGHLAYETGSAGLAAGVGIDLRIENQDLDRHARCQCPGQILEADIEHGAVATDGNHGRTELPPLPAMESEAKAGRPQ